MSTVAVLRIESVKSLRRLRTYITYGIVIAHPRDHDDRDRAQPARRPRARARLLFLASQTGLILPASALRLTSVFLLVDRRRVVRRRRDRRRGDLGQPALRPHAADRSRRRLVLVKFAVAVLYAWIAVVILVVTGLVVGAIFFGTDPIGFPLSLFVGAQSTGDILAHLGVATAYVAWSLTGVVAFSFMVSCMTDVPFGAILAGIGLYFTSVILDAITSLGNIRYVLPTHYFDAWVDLVIRGEWSSDLWRGVGLQLGYVLLFALIGLWWFKRKDILS